MKINVDKETEEKFRKLIDSAKDKQKSREVIKIIENAQIDLFNDFKESIKKSHLELLNHFDERIFNDKEIMDFFNLLNENTIYSACINILVNFVDKEVINSLLMNDIQKALNNYENGKK